MQRLAGTAAQQHVDQGSYVGNVDAAVLVDVRVLEIYVVAAVQQIVDERGDIGDIDSAVIVHVAQHEVATVLEEEVHPLVGCLVQLGALAVGGDQGYAGLIHSGPYIFAQFGNGGGVGLEHLHARHAGHGIVAKVDDALGQTHGVDVGAHVIEGVVADGGDILLEQVACIEQRVARKRVVESEGTILEIIRKTLCA